MSVALTGVIICSLLCLYLTGLKDNGRFSLLDYEASQPIKFIFAIIIIFVHVPLMYQNRLQDLIGSFAFIGVSFFDLSSAFGLKNSCARKENYLKSFWPKRGFEILMPLALVAIIDIFYSSIFTITFGVLIQYKNIYGWILVLAEFYFVFWIIYKVSAKCDLIDKHKDFIICLIILALSLLDYCLGVNIIKGWSLERLGFIAGIALYDYKDRFVVWANKETLKKIILCCLVSGVTGFLYIKTKNIWGVSYGTKALLEYSFLFFIVLWLSKFQTVNKMIKCGGGISYGIYITHPLIFKCLLSTEMKIPSYLFIPIVIVLSMILAAFITTITQRLRPKVSRGFAK